MPSRAFGPLYARAVTPPAPRDPRCFFDLKIKFLLRILFTDFLRDEDDEFLDDLTGIVDLLFRALKGTRFVKELMTTSSHSVVKLNFRLIALSERLSNVINDGFVFSANIRLDAVADKISQSRVQHSIVEELVGPFQIRGANQIGRDEVLLRPSDEILNSLKIDGARLKPSLQFFRQRLFGRHVDFP